MTKFTMFILLLLTLSCSKALDNQLNSNSGTGTDTSKPFTLTPASSKVSIVNNSASQAAITSSNSIQKIYDIGDIKASRTIGFNVGNALNKKITTINFTTDASYLGFTIESIEFLDKGGSQEAFDVEIEHGLKLNGVGSATVLKGALTPTFSITGFIDGDTKVSATYQINLNAKYIDIVLIVDGVTNNLTTKTNTFTGSPFDVSHIPQYKLTSPNSVKIKNIGNVSIEVLIKDYQGVTVLNSTSLTPGNQLESVILTANYSTVVQLSNSGEIGNLSKLTKDHKGYLYFSYYR